MVVEKIHSTYFKGIPMKSLMKWLRVFENNQNGNELYEYFSLKLLELHQGDQIMIAIYRNT